ncbi:MAG: (2Fe-2S)-binding protein [Candidatus Muiribacterium halophilum]|uniref:(2Fe-2S)-binding protein n=1 Tax=Muiribacterium halophilum TaxID=2053465 RepID=A0A2N5ZM32_MUIH1|nr:MAG: (2Fe-2S)-binding protein [Candidatus Muirbacterium halophilum]
MKTITFTINGEKETRDVSESKTLLNFIREDLHLTGTKEGCGEGECGACTIILNGKAVHSCMMLAVEIDGCDVETVEVMSKDGNLDILQEKFIEHNAVQCGFCTPGMLMSARALLLSNPNPTVDEIKTALEGNICRCTGYKQIIEAVSDAAKGGKYE